MATNTQTKLPDNIFNQDINLSLIHQVVSAQLLALRSGNHKTKTRAEVSGAGRKPFKQKGTGNARQGSIRAPHLKGGGIVHGPNIRSYSQRTPKKMVRLALYQALSDRAKYNSVHIVETLTDGKISSKQAAANIAKIANNTLIVYLKDDEITLKSIRNLSNINYVEQSQLNAYDVLLKDNIIFIKNAYDAFIQRSKEND